MLKNIVGRCIIDMYICLCAASHREKYVPAARHYGATMPALYSMLCVCALYFPRVSIFNIPGLWIYSCFRHLPVPQLFSCLCPIWICLLAFGLPTCVPNPASKRFILHCTAELAVV